MKIVLIRSFTFSLHLTCIFRYMYMVVNNCIGSGSSGVEYQRSDRDFLSLRGVSFFLTLINGKKNLSLEYVRKIEIG